METKKCLFCNKKFSKRVNCSKNEWENRTKFCSKECSEKNKVGKKVTHLEKHQFKKGNKSGIMFESGHTPWNLGLKDYLSDEARKNIGDAAKKSISNELPEKRKSRMQHMIESREKNGVWVHGRLGKTGENDPNWKGEEASYNAKHRWIHQHWEKTGTCEQCGCTPSGRTKTRLKYFTHWHNISGAYKRDRSDWLEVCPKCHIKIHKNLN